MTPNRTHAPCWCAFPPDLSVLLYEGLMWQASCVWSQQGLNQKISQLIHKGWEGRCVEYPALPCSRHSLSSPTCHGNDKASNIPPLGPGRKHQTLPTVVCKQARWAHEIWCYSENTLLPVDSSYQPLWTHWHLLAHEIHCVSVLIMDTLNKGTECWNLSDIILHIIMKYSLSKNYENRENPKWRHR